MSERINDGGPAFPHPGLPNATDERADAQAGMTLRDYFAAKAMSGMSTDHPKASAIEEWNFQNIAQCAYRLADAMLAERSKTK